MANGAVGGLGLDPQFVGKAQALLGASRAWNTLKVARSALSKVTEMEVKFGLDLSFPWTLAAGGNFVMACITSGLKSSTIRWLHGNVFIKMKECLIVGTTCHKSRGLTLIMGSPGMLTSRWPIEFSKATIT